MSKVMVTGGAGFIGSNLVDVLVSQGHQVTVIDNESSEVHDQFYWNPLATNVKADICDFGRIKPFFENVSVVFHLAAESRIQPGINNPLLTMKTNVIGTATILQCAREAGVDRLVYSTTSSYYGIKNSIPNIETQVEDCLNPYSISKVSGEKLCNVYNNLYKLKTICLRYFNVYGDREPIRGPYAPVIGLFLRQWKNGEAATIVGDGKQRRDFTHVDDVVNANIIAGFIDSLKLGGGGETYNVGSGRNFSMLEIAEMIGFKELKFLDARQGEARETLAEISKIKEHLGWYPQKDLKSYIDMKTEL